MHPGKPPRTKVSLTPLEIYFREINRTPLLDAVQEKELARRARAGDLEARDLLVRANLRLVVRVACRYARRGCCLEDLIAGGNVGLVKAVGRYDPAHNTRFSTYAFYWIRLAIQQVLSTCKIVRISHHMAGVVSRWARAAGQLRIELGREPTEEEVAGRLNLSARRLPAIKHALRLARMEPVSLESAGTRLPADFLLDERAQSPEATADTVEIRQRLHELLGDLPDRQALVLRLRFGLDGGEAHTLQAIASRMGITRERVRQIETRALDKLRGAVGAGAEKAGS